MNLLVISIAFLLSTWSSLYTRHFELKYHRADRSAINDIANHLEDHYRDYSDFFGSDINHSIKVFVHPDRSSMLAATKLKNPSRWLVGVAINDEEIHIISPLNPPGNHTFESVMDGLLHELVHICVSNITDNTLPIWLNEGLAVYYARQDRFMREVPGIIAKAHEMPHLSEISDSYSFADHHGYPLSYTLVELLVEQYGHDRLAQFVRNYPDYAVFGMENQQELEDYWHLHLMKKYQHPEPLQEWQDFKTDVFQVKLTEDVLNEEFKVEFFYGGDQTFRMIALDAWGKPTQVLVNKKLDTGFHGFKIETQGFPRGVFYIVMSAGNQKQILKLEK